MISLREFSEKKLVLPVFAGITAAVVSCIGYIFMTKMHFGRNYIYANESFNSAEFSVLETKNAVFLAGILSIAELILTSLVILMCIWHMYGIFKREKRTVALPMLKVSFVFVFVAGLCEAVRKVLTVLETHLATNTDVLEYIRNKATITSAWVYEKYMSNPLIANFEKVSSAAYYCAFISAFSVLACIVYMLRIRRFTDGDSKQ